MEGLTGRLHLSMKSCDGPETALVFIVWRLTFSIAWLPSTRL